MSPSDGKNHTTHALLIIQMRILNLSYHKLVKTLFVDINAESISLNYFHVINQVNKVCSDIRERTMLSL